MDPLCRWVLTQAKLWIALCKMKDTGDILDGVAKTRRNSRLSALMKVLGDRDWVLTKHEIITPNREIRFRSDWPVIRKIIVEEWKRQEWARLALRRPTVFGGLTVLDVKSHVQMMRSLSTYRETTLLRVWAGCPMTRAHRSTVDPLISPLCECARERQTIEHLLLRCPARKNPPIPTQRLKDMSTAMTQALLLMKGECAEVKRAWKQACHFIVDTLTSKQQIEPCEQLEPIVPHHLKGHAICVEHTGCYSYCARCQVARCIRDAHFIGVKECAGIYDPPLCEGNYFRQGSHCIQMTMRTWKNACLRPRLRCVHCGKEAWATKGISGECI